MFPLSQRCEGQTRWLLYLLQALSYSLFVGVCDMKYRCAVCKADYWDPITKERHSNFYHKGMEYSREIGKEWEMFVES